VGAAILDIHEQHANLLLYLLVEDSMIRHVVSKWWQLTPNPALKRTSRMRQREAAHLERWAYFTL